MQDLGADEEGKISFEKFLNRKIALRPEIHALKKKHSSRDTNDYIPTSSNNSLGKHDCWEFDSGARDLSPEPSTLQRLIDTAGGSTSTGNLLQLANKVRFQKFYLEKNTYKLVTGIINLETVDVFQLHLAALASLRAEITELNTRLQSVTEERDILESALKKCQVSKTRCTACEDEQLWAQFHQLFILQEKSEQSAVQRYEEQITELHSVIAELNKKLDTQRTRIIAEEEDVLSGMNITNVCK